MNIVIDKEKMCASYGGVVHYAFTERAMESPTFEEDFQHLVRARVEIILSMPDSDRLLISDLCPQGITITEAKARLLEMSR